MVQALTRHPFTQKLNDYCIIQLQKNGLANGVYRVESLIFQKNILVKMVKELRSSKTIVSGAGGVC